MKRTIEVTDNSKNTRLMNLKKSTRNLNYYPEEVLKKISERLKKNIHIINMGFVLKILRTIFPSIRCPRENLDKAFIYMESGKRKC